MLEATRTASLVVAARRAFDMSNVDLGRVIASSAKEMVKQLEKLSVEIFSDEVRMTLHVFFDSLIPEIADRLARQDGVHMVHSGRVSFSMLSQENLRAEFVRHFTSPEFRLLVSHLQINSESTALSDVNLLLAQAVNGNIAIIALDRMSDAQKNNDRIGAMIAMTGKLRGARCEDGKWQPKLTNSLLLEVDICRAEREAAELLAGGVTSFTRERQLELA